MGLTRIDEHLKKLNDIIDLDHVSRAEDRVFASVSFELGGGWIHYCGNGSHILPEVLSTERVTGINFGNPEMQDIASVCKSARARQIAVLGWRMDVPLPDWLYHRSYSCRGGS